MDKLLYSKENSLEDNSFRRRFVKIEIQLNFDCLVISKMDRQTSNSWCC